jgi:hypothetical protein
MRSLRTRAVGLVKQATGDASYSDVNYVFPRWITTALPIGIVGLWIAAIITAATDSIAGRAQLAVDGERHRLLQKARPA